MANDERRIQEIVEKVLERVSGDPAVQAVLNQQGGAAPSGGAGPTIHVPRASVDGRHGIFGDVDSAMAAARVAHEKLVQETSIDVRKKAIEAIRDVTVERSEELSRMVVEETGLGRVAHKINKNICAATMTPGMEALAPVSFTGDHGLTLDERAPYGVIGDITPCTNATETIINLSSGLAPASN